MVMVVGHFCRLTSSSFFLDEKKWQCEKRTQGQVGEQTHQQHFTLCLLTQRRLFF